MASETVVVITHDPGLEGYSVARASLNCGMCKFKTAMMKKRKAKRSLSIHNKSDHQKNTVTSNEMAYVQESVEIAPTSTKVSLQLTATTELPY